MEWIVVDDGSDKISNELHSAIAENTTLRYFAIPEKMKLGNKRNFMNSKARGDIIVYMDDDDYYPAERVTHAVEMLQKNPDKICAGTSHLYLYFADKRKMFEYGPYHANHATAATFAFRRELLKITCFDDDACLAEERVFLQNLTIPIVQLDPIKTILVFPHSHNSFDKHALFDMPTSNVFRESTQTLDAFIPSHESDTFAFFTEHMHHIIADYPAGTPANKPDVIEYSAKLKFEHAVSHAVIRQTNYLTQIIQQQTNVIEELQKKLDTYKEREKKRITALIEATKKNSTDFVK